MESEVASTAEEEESIVLPRGLQINDNSKSSQSVSFQKGPQ